MEILDIFFVFKSGVIVEYILFFVCESCKTWGVNRKTDKEIRADAGSVVKL